MRKFMRTLGGLKVSKRPGPNTGSRSMKLNCWRSVMIWSRMSAIPRYLRRTWFRQSSVPIFWITGMIRSGENFWSTTIAERKRSKPCRSTVLDGIPTMIRGALARRVPHRSHVAHGAVQEHPVDSLDLPLRDPDRQVLARLVDEAQRLEPFSGEVFREELGERHPDGIGDPGRALSPGGPVLEMVLDLLVGDGFVAREPHHGGHCHDDQEEHDDEAEDAEAFGLPARCRAQAWTSWPDW